LEAKPTWINHFTLKQCGSHVDFGNVLWFAFSIPPGSLSLAKYPVLLINYILGAVSIPLPNAGSRNLYNDPLARQCFIRYSTTSESETIMNK
jgi:hypothetical protein